MLNDLEKLLNDKLHPDIVKILKRSGFDTIFSISSINESAIAEIEQYASEDKTVLKNTSYEHTDNFMFKPGHKLSILNLSNHIKSLSEKKSDEKEQYDSFDFSFILRTLIDTAQNNSMRHPKGYRYNEVVRYFATYVYLLCGKACYETLSSNLPIPQASTICKHFVNYFPYDSFSLFA